MALDQEVLGSFPAASIVSSCEPVAHCQVSLNKNGRNQILTTWGNSYKTSTNFLFTKFQNITHEDSRAGLFLSILYWCAVGSGCSTAKERTPHDREVLGSNPARCWDFFSSLSHQWCVLNLYPSRRCNTTDFLGLGLLLDLKCFAFTVLVIKSIYQV